MPSKPAVFKFPFIYGPKKVMKKEMTKKDLYKNPALAG